ncbi:MAG: GH39 family glycosyl hydrolase, partial [Nocardioides sp.]
ERVDQDHSNVAATWGRLRDEGQAWPTDEQWEVLRSADRLEELEPVTRVTADDDGAVRLATSLPMPSMSLLTLTPA